MTSNLERMIFDGEGKIMNAIQNPDHYNGVLKSGEHLEVLTHYQVAIMLDRLPDDISQKHNLKLTELVRGGKSRSMEWRTAMRKVITSIYELKGKNIRFVTPPASSGIERSKLLEDDFIFALAVSDKDKKN